MGIVFGPVDVTEIPFRQEQPMQDGSGAQYGLVGMEPKIIGVKGNIEFDAIDLNALADIAGNQAGEIAVLPKVLELLFAGLIDQVQRFAQRSLNALVIGIQIEEIGVERTNMVLRFDRNILLAIGRQGFQRLAVGQDIDLVLRERRQLIAFIEYQSAKTHAANKYRDGKTSHMSESAIQSFQLHKGHKQVLKRLNKVFPEFLRHGSGQRIAADPNDLVGDTRNSGVTDDANDQENEIGCIR